MSPRRGLLALLFCASLVGCDQLGNPPQYTTGPTEWKDVHGHLVTQTRSFRDEKTIRRLVSEGLGELDHADPSVGPGETLTIVLVAPRSLLTTRSSHVRLVTVFQLPGQPPVARRWKAPATARRWGAAFALPEPPSEAVTSLAP